MTNARTSVWKAQTKKNDGSYICPLGNGLENVLFCHSLLLSAGLYDGLSDCPVLVFSLRLFVRELQRFLPAWSRCLHTLYLKAHTPALIGQLRRPFPCMWRSTFPYVRRHCTIIIRLQQCLRAITNENSIHRSPCSFCRKNSVKMSTQISHEVGGVRAIVCPLTQ